MCVGAMQVTMLSLYTSMNFPKTLITVLVTCAFTLAEENDTDVSSEGQGEPLTPRSTLRSNFVWRVSFTRTTTTTEWISSITDSRDPYRKLVTIMEDTFKNPKHREQIRSQARANYPEFLANLRLAGPEKFVDKLADEEFILYSDLLEKKRMWMENWPTIINFFDMIGEQGFEEMLNNMDDAVNKSPGWRADTSAYTPTYWTPEPPFSPSLHQDFFQEMFRRMTVPPPGNYTVEPVKTPTTPQGVIFMPSTLNYSSNSDIIESESSVESLRMRMTTERTVAPPDEELQALFANHFNRTRYNKTCQDKRQQELENEFGGGQSGLFFEGHSSETEIVGTEPTKKILTHEFTKPTPVLCHLVTTSATTMTTTGSTTLRPMFAWVEELNNLTHGTAVDYVFKLISTTTEKRRKRKLKPGQTEPPEDSTMYISPEYVVDENQTNPYTYEELTIATRKKIMKLKYTLPSTTTLPTSSKTKHRGGTLKGRKHANVSKVLSKLHNTIRNMSTTHHIP
ncbi:uncharacterized protein LOC103516965 [Diaphorina citri]|uniref:Uncharacterized protein LOC103516965 n=1 Tax=Diaphorina citri TaxID=121845 RepID=A0A1S3DED0_DIACI|nr:uncharacterized protein LOC103516965 [Diaphorina citri]